MVGRSAETGRRSFTPILPLLLALVTAACATYTGTRYGGPDAPLRARLASTFELSARSPTVHFAVSDRAHVALFRVSGSGYVRALYPYDPSGANRFDAGPHSVFSSGPSHGWSRPGLGAARFVGGFGRPFSLGPGATRGIGPYGVGRADLGFVMIVASRAPLRLDGVRGDVPFRYRRARALASPLQGGSAFGTMDRLLDRLIPAGLSRDDWAVDWVHTSVEPPRFRPLPRRIAVRAPDAGSDSAAGSSDEGRAPGPLATGDLPFEPPRIPVDLPRLEPPTEREDTRRRTPVSEHFGRLFDDGRSDAEGWVPGAERRRVGPRERSRRDRSRPGWSDRLEAWARNPETNAFPDPPRRPDRLRGPDRWPGHPGPVRVRGRPGAGGEGRAGARPPDVRVPRTPPAGEIRVERPGSGAASDGGGGGRRSGGGDDGGETRHE